MKDFIESLWKCISVPELLPKLDCSRETHWCVSVLCVCTWFSAALGVCVLWSVKAEEISSSVWWQRDEEETVIRSSSISLVAYMCLTTHNNIHLQTVSFFYSDTLIIILVVFMYSSVDLVLYCCNVYLNLFIFYSSLRFICSVLLCWYMFYKLNHYDCYLWSILCCHLKV